MDEKIIYFKDRKEWRTWLKENHKKEKAVSVLKYKKHTGRPSLSHKESMDEAICFGWIDTTVKRLDEDRYVRRFAKRGKNSRWSSATLGYAKRLIAEKKMSPEGLKYYLEGLKKPTIDSDVPKNPEMSADLRDELKKNKPAFENFEKFPPSAKRMYLRWVERAKLAETRKKRIQDVVKRALENRKKWL